MTVKVFGVGLPRTGNQSLRKALEILGYNTVHYPQTIDVLDHYDAATEVRFPICKLLDRWPDCRLIITVRSVSQWYESMQRVRQKMKPAFAVNPIWSCPPESWVTRYHTRLGETMTAPFGQWLSLFIARKLSPPGWSKLCQFLDKPVPSVGFPQEDRFSEAEKDDDA